MTKKVELKLSNERIMELAYYSFLFEGAQYFDDDHIDVDPRENFNTKEEWCLINFTSDDEMELFVYYLPNYSTACLVANVREVGSPAQKVAFKFIKVPLTDWITKDNTYKRIMSKLVSYKSADQWKKNIKCYLKKGTGCVLSGKGKDILIGNLDESILNK